MRETSWRPLDLVRLGHYTIGSRWADLSLAVGMHHRDTSTAFGCHPRPSWCRFSPEEWHCRSSCGNLEGTRCGWCPQNNHRSHICSRFYGCSPRGPCSIHHHCKSTTPASSRPFVVSLTVNRGRKPRNLLTVLSCVTSAVVQVEAWVSEKVIFALNPLPPVTECTWLEATPGLNRGSTRSVTK